MSRKVVRLFGQDHAAGKIVMTKICNRLDKIMPRTVADHMQWTDEGIVLGTKRHGEANAILELMTCDHGRHLGLVRGGSGSRLRPVLRRVTGSGDLARASRRTSRSLRGRRLDARAASFLPVSYALYGMTHLAALCRLLPELDPHPQIHAALDEVLDACSIRGVRGLRGALRAATARGADFGLDLENCAATGHDHDLIYVSPKSGARYRGPQASRGVIGCCLCRRFFARSSEGRPAGSGRRLCCHRLFPDATCVRAARPCGAEARASFMPQYEGADEIEGDEGARGPWRLVVGVWRRRCPPRKCHTANEGRRREYRPLPNGR